MNCFTIGFRRLAVSVALLTAVIPGFVTEASAQSTHFRVRVSVKRVLGPNGALHNNFDLATVRLRMREANSLLNDQLGIQLVLSEVIDLPDPEPTAAVPSWFTVTDKQQLEAMEAAAMARPTRYGWRSNAINIYLIENHYVGGTCLHCSGGAYGELIVVGPCLGSLSWAHEIGHYFGLMHTFDAPHGVETYVACQAVSPNGTTAGDLVADTPADPYDSSPSQTMAVNIANLNARFGSGSCFGANSPEFLSLRNNVMSYYGPIAFAEALFTPGQKLRALATLSLHRQHVVEPFVTAHYTDLGQGISGAQGIPILELSPPRLGRQLHIGTSRAAVSSVAFLVIGFNPVFSPIAGGTLVPSTDLVLPTLTDSDGTANATVWLPNIRGLVGLPLYMQSLSVDAASIAFSNGARGELFQRVESDFNGDGYADMAVGAPAEEVNGSIGAGAVNVVYGGSPGLGWTNIVADMWHQDSPGIFGVCETDDAFGHAIAHGDFNGDGFADLAIGAPEEQIGSSAEAGGVHVLYGGSGGLTAAGSQFWEQGTSGLIAVAREAFDRFGETLAAGDINGDGFADLAIGAPSEDIGSTVDAGAVTVLFGSSTGLTVSGSETWHQNTAGMPGVAEHGDGFGDSLTIDDFDHDGYADLAIGIPREDLGSIVDAGAVHVLRGSSAGLTLSGNQSWHQDEAGVLGAAESNDRFGAVMTTGDFNGDGFADLAVGVPYEDVANTSSVGIVQVLYGSGSGLNNVGGEIWTQDSVGVYGTEEAGDWFGYALAAGDFDGDGVDDLAVSAPGEDLNNTIAAGMVNVLQGGPCGLSGGVGRYWHQDVPGITDTAEAGDTFGAALACGDTNGDGCDDLMIGVPKEDVGATLDAGVVHLLYGRYGVPGLTALYDQLWHQGVVTVNYGAMTQAVVVPGAVEGSDQFGSTLAN